jgi:hypothetical protein
MNKEYAKKHAAYAIKTGCNPDSYKIMSMLPATIKQIQESTGKKLTTIYWRMRRLQKAGLVNWQPGTTNFEKTELTDVLLDAIEQLGYQAEVLCQ